MRTKGLSNKIIPPVLAAVTALVGPWIVSGHVDRQLASGLAVALIGAIAAYFTAADEVVPTDEPPPLHTFNITSPTQPMDPIATANAISTMRLMSGRSNQTIAIPDIVTDDEVEDPNANDMARKEAPVMPSQVAPEGEPDELDDDPPHESAPLDVIAAEEPLVDDDTMASESRVKPDAP